MPLHRHSIAQEVPGVGVERLAFMENVRVLVLEDDPAMLATVTELLQEEGFEPLAAANGMQAIELAGRHLFDLVVVDVRMEGMDGLEALSAMQQQLQGAASLVMTGYASEEDSVRALRLGVGDYLRKPFGQREFLETVQRLVAQTRQRRSAAAEESRWRHSGLYAWQRLGRATDRRLGGCLQLARRLLQGLDLGPTVAASVETAVLVAALRALGQDTPADHEFPATIRSTLENIEARWEQKGEQIPVTSRLAAIAVSAGLDEVEAAELGDRDPGRFDPGLLQLVQQPARSGERLSSGGMLLLAQALLRSGDSENARRGFEQIAAAGASQDKPAALLGLARMAEPEQQAELLRQALAACRHQSAVVAGRAYLEAGLLGMQQGYPEAGEILQQAAARLHSSGLEAEAARADLAAAVAAGQGGQLQTLLRPENQAELLACAVWLCRPLLEWAGDGDEQATRALARLARSATATLLSRVSPQTPGQRLALARALAGVPEGKEMLQSLAAAADPEVRSQAQSSLAALQEEARPPLLRLYSCGPMEVFLGERAPDPAAWKAQRYRYVFAYLAAHGGRPVIEDRLIDEFWPDDFAKGKRGLYSAISAIRKALRPPGWEHLDVICRESSQLMLDPKMERWHDYEELQQCFEKARSDEGEAALDALRRAAALYRGPYLEGCYLDWALRLRGELEQQMLQALGRLAAETPWEEAADHCRRMLEIDRCNTEAHRLLMEGFLAQNRPEETVRQYEHCCKVLKQDLDLEPPTEMVRLYHQARLSL